MVLAVLVAQVALAGGTSSSDSRDIASLRRANASLQQQINQLRAQMDGDTRAAKKKRRRGPAGPPGAPGAQGPQGPPGPSTGPAGGDLTGNYPDPLVGPNAIETAEIANLAVTTGKLANNAVTTFKVSTGFAAHVTLADDATGNARGWNPNGALTEFNIDDPDLDNAAFDFIVLELNDVGGATTNAICGVTDISINGDFDMDCNVAPANGIELHYLKLSVQPDT